ncbi:MAG: hypothetical protein BroJett011_65330 [Chloroflexota bacterium]|nr:MAG: hypothetical protein BroJett011_65330 [Chloroflexota bacterium]
MPRYSSQPQPENLSDFLQSYTVPNLKKLAGLVSSALPTRKDELIATLQNYLGSPENLRQLWQRLDSVQQAAVTEAVHSSGGIFEADQFRAKYGRDPNWGETSSYGEMKEPSRLNLLIHNRHKIPRDVQQQLKAFVPLPQAVQINTVDEPPATITQTWQMYDYQTRSYKSDSEEITLTRVETERAALHDVHTLLRLIDTGKIRASDKTRRVTSAGAKAINEVLQGGDFYPPDTTTDEFETDPWPIKAFAWPLLLQSAGLAELAGTKLQLTPAGKKALTQPAEEVIRTCWNRWQKSTLLDEFNRVQAIKGQGGKGKRDMTAPSSRRAVIVKALKECPPRRWLTVDEFSRFMRATGQTFEIARDLWDLYISDPQYGSLGYAGFGDWPILQGRYILTFLFEYAATLGLIDVAYIEPAGARNDYNKLWGVDDLDCLSRYDGLLYFRLNALGAWVLGLTKDYTPSPIEVRSVLKVLPNHDIVATEILPPGDVLFLEQFAERTSDMVWKIQPAKVLKAVEEGHAVADLQVFLQAKSGDALPDNVGIFFQELADRATQLQDRGPARLIEAKDAALAHLIANDSRLRSLCMVAGERHLVVAAENETAFRRLLRELGYAVVGSKP